MAGVERCRSRRRAVAHGAAPDLARYPMHWHLIGEGQGSTSGTRSIHDTYSRCVTVHGTNNVQSREQRDLQHRGSLLLPPRTRSRRATSSSATSASMTKCHPTQPCEPTNLTLAAPQTTNGPGSASTILIPSDNTVSTVLDHQSGQRLPRQRGRGVRPDRLLDGLSAASDRRARRQGGHGQTPGPGGPRLREFSGNVAHSNFDGLMLDRGPRPDGKFGIAGPNPDRLRRSGRYRTASGVVSVFDNFTGYKNRNGAIWGRGEKHLYTNLKLADNAIGFTPPCLGRAPASRLHLAGRRLAVRRRERQYRQPHDAPPPPPAGSRLRPQPAAAAAADFPIRGYEYYDFRHEVENTTFVNYVPNARARRGRDLLPACSPASA